VTNLVPVFNVWNIDKSFKVSWSEFLDGFRNDDKATDQADDQSDRQHTVRCLKHTDSITVHSELNHHIHPTVIYLMYCVSGSTLKAVRRSQLLAWWPGTHSQILSGIQRAAQTVLGVYLKRTCSRDTSASSAALGVLNDYVLYKSTHSLTHTHSSSTFCLFTIKWPVLKSSREHDTLQILSTADSVSPSRFTSQTITCTLFLRSSFYLYFPYFPFLVLCGRLSWLSVSIWVHLKYFLSYHIRVTQRPRWRSRHSWCICLLLSAAWLTHDVASPTSLRRIATKHTDA